ncbi:MAG: SsrA-binding protein SmpB [Candidatus Delongbacteria bacterium]|jgi:SsrA-binding protein|nr:SsrA-binding protein SmpB [Candidatus Delongbacteria bacterium]
MAKNKKNKIPNNTLARNKKAFHDYEIMDRHEAGIVLVGSEVKSIKQGRISLKESYCKFIDNQLFVIGMHVSEFKNASTYQHDITRSRKLLLHKRELHKLSVKMQNTGLTIIPLKVYKVRHLIKIEIGLCKGKREYEKRQSIKDRENRIELDRVTKAFRN